MPDSAASTAQAPARPIWFEPFLQQLKQDLGYAYNLGKHKQLLEWANMHPWSGDDFPFEPLYTVCRLLFLENIDDEKRFDRIFVENLVNELSYEQQFLPKKEIIAPRPVDPIIENLVPNIGGPDRIITPEPETILDQFIPEPPDAAAPPLSQERAGSKYLNLKIDIGASQSPPRAGSAKNSRFLLQEDYLPVNARDMVHAWRHLRKSDREQPGSRLDVLSTVLHIAQEGILLNPVFYPEPVNSDDLLVILVDRKGSMEPFHLLCDRLVEKARKEGGHRNAQVYYFYNCPTKYLYKNPNLIDPEPVEKVLGAMRPDHTNVLIISDAGAARGGLREQRLQDTWLFLNGDGEEKEGVHKRAHFVAWLNPMPEERWRRSSAEYIAYDMNTPMFSLMDGGYGAMLQAMRSLMGK